MSLAWIYHWQLEQVQCAATLQRVEQLLQAEADHLLPPTRQVVQLELVALRTSLGSNLANQELMALIQARWAAAQPYLVYIHSDVITTLANSCQRLGAVETGLAMIAATLEQNAALPPITRCSLLNMRALLYLWDCNIRQAERDFLTNLHQAQRRGFALIGALCQLGLGAIAHARYQLEAAETYLTPVLTTSAGVMGAMPCRQALITRQMTGGTAERPSADQIDASFAEAQGITGDGAEALAALRALPAETLAGDLNLENVLKAALLGLPLAGAGMVDGTIAPDEPQALFASGGAANVPLIIGTTAADLPLIFPPSKLDPFGYFGADAEAARTAYNAPATLDQQSLTMLLLSIGADMTMHEPARFVAKAMTAAGNPTWLYRFTYVAESARPTTTVQSHAGELPFLFATLPAKYGDQVTANDQGMAQAFNHYVDNFIKNGDPNGGDLPAWSPFDPATFAIMDFTLDNGPLFGPEPWSGVALVERAADAQ